MINFAVKILVQKIRKVNTLRKFEMSPAVRILAFLNRNIVAVVMIPSIAFIHWGWLKIQDVEALVKKEEKKDLPILLALKYVVEQAEGKFQSFKKDDTSKPTSCD